MTPQLYTFMRSGRRCDATKMSTKRVSWGSCLQRGCSRPLIIVCEPISERIRTHPLKHCCGTSSHSPTWNGDDQHRRRQSPEASLLHLGKKYKEPSCARCTIQWSDQKQKYPEPSSQTGTSQETLLDYILDPRTSTIWRKQTLPQPDLMTLRSGVFIFS